MSPPHPEAPEGSLQQLDLNADNPKSAVFEQHQHQKQQQQQPDTEPPAALQNAACLAATFSWLDTEQSLLQCSAVCRLWHSVLEADDIWSRVYLRSLPEPLPFERVGRWVCPRWCLAPTHLGGVGEGREDRLAVCFRMQLQPPPLWCTMSNVLCYWP